MSSFESQTLRNLPSEIWGPCGSSWKCAACGQPLWSPLGFMLVTAQALTSWLTCSEMGYLDKSGSGTKTVYNLSLEKNEKYTWFFRFRGTQPSSKNISVQNPLAPPKKIYILFPQPSLCLVEFENDCIFSKNPKAGKSTLFGTQALNRPVIDQGCLYTHFQKWRYRIPPKNRKPCITVRPLRNRVWNPVRLRSLDAELRAYCKASDANFQWEKLSFILELQGLLQDEEVKKAQNKINSALQSSLMAGFSLFETNLQNDQVLHRRYLLASSGDEAKARSALVASLEATADSAKILFPET